MKYLKFNTTEIRAKFDNQKDYEIYMIRQFGSCGVSDWLTKENLEQLNNATRRILFVLLMTDNHKNRTINQLEGRVRDLERELEVYKEYD